MPTEASLLDAAQQRAVKDLQKHRAHRNDAWVNTRSGFGSQADPVLFSKYLRTRLRMTREDAEALYENDWLTGRVVDQPARDATREWISYQHTDDPDKAEALRKLDDDLGTRGLFEECKRTARLHGGCLMVIGAWDGRSPEQPLDITRVTEILYINIVDRWFSYPEVFYDDPDDRQFGKPKIYRIHRVSQGGVAPGAIYHVHESRCIRFEGDWLPVYGRIRNWGWGASVVQKIFDALRNWGMSQQAAASIVPSFVTIAFQIGNLKELIQANDWDTIKLRLNEFAAQLASQNIAFHGPDESIQKLGSPISGLPELMKVFMDVVAGAVNIPKSILFQAESGSLGGSAAGEDRDNYFNYIAAEQRNDLAPKIRRFHNIVGMTIGLEPDEVNFTFNPLSQLTPTQKADIYFKTAQADNLYIQSGVVDTPERLAVYRFSGQQFNPDWPVYKTDRQEKFLEQLDAQPVELVQPPDPNDPAQQGAKGTVGASERSNAMDGAVTRTGRRITLDQADMAAFTMDDYWDAAGQHKGWADSFDAQVGYLMHTDMDSDTLLAALSKSKTERDWHLDRKRWHEEQALKLDDRPLEITATRADDGTLTARVVRKIT